MPCTKRMAGCGLECLHRQRVETYKWDRINWNQRLENTALGYTQEGIDFREAEPPPTFKKHLIQTRGENPVVDVPYDKQPKLTPQQITEGKAYIRELIQGDLAGAAELVDARKALAEAYQDSAPAALSVTQARMGVERELLGTVMKAPSAVAALQVLDIDRELLHPLHRNVAHAITDLAVQGKPYDAAAVTDELRGRPLLDVETYPAAVTDKPYGIDNPWTPSPPAQASQLPWHMDPEQVHPSIAPEKIGLHEWEHNALPAQAAPTYAMEIRTAYRGDYIAQVCERGAQLARGATAESVNGFPGTDSVGTVLGQVAQDLVNVPPELGHDLKPLQRGQAPDPSSIRTVVPSQYDLAMPHKPVLSAASQKILAQVQR